MSQQFCRHFVALRDNVATSLGEVPAENRVRRATQLLHRLMFLAFLRHAGLLKRHSTSELLRRLPFGMPLPEPPSAMIVEVETVLDRFAWSLFEPDPEDVLSPSILADTFEQSVNRRRLAPTTRDAM